jgi:hypothetical protein
MTLANGMSRDCHDRGSDPSHSEQDMIIWKGWGILTLVIAVVATAMGALISPGGAGLGLLVGAGVNWFVGQNLNRPLREAGLGSGQRHTLFWIPMEWWSIAMAALAIAGIAVLLAQ